MKEGLVGGNMPVLNIAMVGSDELAKEVAKSTDQRDVHTYVHKEIVDGQTRILSLIRPAKYPERLRPLLNALSAARAGLIEVTAIDATLGEVLVAFASAGIEHGVAVIAPPQGEWIDEDMAKSLFKQAGLSKWTFEKAGGIELRNALFTIMDNVSELLASIEELPLVVPIDQHFNVKGIGLVAIGYVQSGVVSVHDEVTMLPHGGTGLVKSLQVMDDDVERAGAGDRVGIALRNAKEESLSGTCLITHPEIEDKKTNTFRPLALEAHTVSSMELTGSPFQKKQLEAGDVVHASIDLQFNVGRIESVEGTNFTVRWETPLLQRIKDSPAVLIAQLDSKPRIMGSAQLRKVE
ncbi:MAG: hypothetical protein CMA41_00250 [Euryarchaeota archaeon]|jgi:selenocysteine-specific translation elongation factor|nr:hypothetical protein [Euryarchaeota archaeon]MBF14137.1 hypothetical protein [Euryarchaeota archaeon]CAI8320388.1 MAG: Selenocysteine-specific elongation factor [Euryarchaeota archaeon UBA443]|tara:strand:+ start:1333 stop:2382 length:1050 start_codon:yes stop_codon:yes gene_type:complete